MEQNRSFSFRRGNVRKELKLHRRGLSLLFDRKSIALGSRVRNIYDQIRVFNVVVMKSNSTFSDSPEKSTGIQQTEEEFEMKSIVGEEIEENGRESSCSSDFLTSETTRHGGQSPSSTENFSISTFSSRWSLKKSPSDCETLEKQSSKFSETEMMKERFSKLLLGEDMSGSGNGVCTALAISNAITNLCATSFGKLWRLEPLPQHKKEMWRREMNWLLCVSDHIVEMTPTWQTFPDGSKLEIMTCKPRSDLDANLPALRKLDNMLLEILDSFEETEFWYVDQGIETPDSPQNRSKTLQRQEEKWWLPVPRVSPKGLQENTRKQLQYKRDCTNQILKAAIAINNITISDMEVPESYLESLPKNGRSCLGDMIYKYISSDQFSPESLLDILGLSSEHNAIEIANRLESSIHLWGKRINTTTSWSTNSWEMVKELMVDTEKQELMADRAQTLLHSLKLRFPGLRQTVLDMSKIQFNKDIGKSILESYSRVLESLAFNIVSRIDDLLFVDDLTRQDFDQVSAKSEFCSLVKPVLTDSVEKTEERVKGQWLKPVRSTLSRSSLEQCMKDSVNIQNLEPGELKI